MSSFTLEIPTGLLKLKKKTVPFKHSDFDDLAVLQTWIDNTPNWHAARVRGIWKLSPTKAPEDVNESLLTSLVVRRKVDAVRILLENGANPNEIDKWKLTGRTVLQACNSYSVREAASLNECTTKIVDLLLKHGADIHGKDRDGNTALHWAIIQNSKNGHHFLRILLERGANVNIRNRYGLTPLMQAAHRTGTLDAILIFLEPQWGVDIHARSTFGYTALTFAARATSPDVAYLLLERGAKVVDDEKSTRRKDVALNLVPLLESAESGNVELTFVLLKQVVEVRAQPFAWLNEIARKEITHGTRNPFFAISQTIRYHAPWNQYHT